MSALNLSRSCRRRATGSFRTLATATEAAHPVPRQPPVAPSPVPPPPRSGKPTLSASVILNRAPILTREPTPFERAFFAYQQRVRRALHNPFPEDFYFKQGSLLATKFRAEEIEREREAFGNGFGIEEEKSADRAAADAAALEQLRLQEGEGDELPSREHRADTKKDYRSLDRAGQRNIYALVFVNGEWRFPTGDIKKGEWLHQAAQRDLQHECGAHMDTWIVSRNPIGVYKPKAPADTPAPESATFFYKAHILAGQIRPANGATDFVWLTRRRSASASRQSTGTV
ncbi:39S mitochondrial ribosomal protein L46-domain-containing protein [Schizophyllum amplum]|uniref:Large ribosomal subunit protein mL46 n=1 Tax=Schizophyllum amplum TaxID=97359 RepID=A0A550C3N8_9AGAR|nr:39S mitochondrial ribosomal protein L46-domain-containing protein [Auriculariopsis ampla]